MTTAALPLPSGAPASIADAPAALDVVPFVRQEAGSGTNVLHLLVEGVHCGACIRRIERALQREGGLETARVNLTTRRLTIRWNGEPVRGNRLAQVVTDLGYGVVPFDPDRLKALDNKAESELLRCLAVAGFAAGNVMLLAVSVWAGHFYTMGEATRTFFHWFEALIALPAIAYAGRPFFRSAFKALRAGHTNMDVPISLAVLLAPGMSLVETIRSGEHAYFDSAITLLFFLLIGRYLDQRARGTARSAAERLLALNASAVTLVLPDGTTRSVRPEQLEAGQEVLVATGERVGVDGVVIEGASELDTSLITGETVPQRVGAGERVFAGTINLGAPLRLKVRAVGEGTLLAEIVRLMELAEQRRSRFVAIADRVAKAYAPAVHGLAAITFLGWTLTGAVGWQTALLYAIAVLIVTCPCALGLAVPAVQVLASGRLMRHGTLLKSATALERFARADTVVFDKTGTLTTGRLELERGGIAPDVLTAAAGMAKASHHPLARALAAAAPDAPAVSGVEEVPGMGLRLVRSEGEWRLGRRGWAADVPEDATVGAELWFARPGVGPVRLAFVDRVREDAAVVVHELKRRGYRVVLLSGDREPTVRAIADELGIAEWHAALKPQDKTARLEALAAEGRKVLMVGDGLNDAPALAAAYVSLSPATAVDISQTAADAVFQGQRLAPVLAVIDVAKRAERLVKQNFALSFGYNVFTVPLAMAGLVTPLVAAIAMSTSSIVVVLNSLRLNWTTRRATSVP
ncbi:heavy metal translocating P-type ATPase [Benzoatithermus flavus]|uniref:Heavy metal translocating P-type ATPase n=1 Tax=Benzoatithermus flavus TaxID=3108223 RepID=A0ABU8XV26_9PROT